MTELHKKGKTTLAAVAAVLLAVALSALPAAAQQIPPIPERFYGTVRVAGSPATAGTAVEAYVGSALKASTTVDSQGRYGYSPLFYVTDANRGQVIIFKVGGVQANETAVFEPGAIIQLDLTVGTGGAAPPPPPPPPPPGPPSPPSTPIPQTPERPIVFKWSAVDGASKYHLQVNTSQSFTGTMIYDNDALSATSQQVLVPIGTTCYWRVRAGSSAGWSDWSAAQSISP